ncbi:hypothetical protein P8S54_07615 [Thiomicrospira sp. R3]|uniref:hypothetical protein n=1 Tax=Thiomicrospira sp. R3 TaxID=3035472 RepID=UPI00259B7976|nr:hypothetical protein [Thiomicrospira sp. R3]WFE68091.1 hypothetical protein P8S54_07615 [Thiomicrospira sp. R3]
MNHLNDIYDGSQACIGDEFNFFAMAQQISLCAIGLQFEELTPLVAKHLYESGCFSVKVYDTQTKESWDPMRLRFSEFAATRSKLSAYIDFESTKSLDDIKKWLNSFEAHSC